jgi:integrase
MRTYTAKHNKLDDAELRVRKIVQHYVLIAANSGLRVGEQRQLRWSDVQIEQHKVNGEQQKLARIHVRAETSKVRTSRTFLCRNGQYFERLQEISKPKSADELIFTVDNANELSKRTLLYHWHKMIELVDIADREVRDLVPYSLRHFMITQRIMSGLTFRQIADMCGTSVAQIEKTYYHLNDEIRLTNAVADYRRRDDGTIEVV